MNKLLEQSAQTLSFSSATAEEKTAVLKSKKLYSGLRISFSYTDNGAVDASSALEMLSSIVIDVPDYGNNSRRVDLSGNTMALLPVIAQLGATNTMDAASRTSQLATNPINQIPLGFAYVDIPINKKNLDEDIRVTIKAIVETADQDVLTVAFAFLDTPLRNVFFRAYDTGATTSHQQWFPADGTLRGVSITQYDTAWTPGVSNAFAFAARDDDVTKVTLNGEQDTTYSNPSVLMGGLDEIVSGGPTGAAATWAAYDNYSMFANFPTLTGAQYVQVDSSASEPFLILGVMSDD
jgi:hypothetical protein